MRFACLICCAHIILLTAVHWISYTLVYHTTHDTIILNRQPQTASIRSTEWQMHLPETSTHSGRKWSTHPTSRLAPLPLPEVSTFLPTFSSLLCWACYLETGRDSGNGAGAGAGAGQSSCFATWALPRHRISRYHSGGFSTPSLSFNVLSIGVARWSNGGLVFVLGSWGVSVPFVVRTRIHYSTPQEYQSPQQFDQALVVCW